MIFLLFIIFICICGTIQCLKWKFNYTHNKNVRKLDYIFVYSYKHPTHIQLENHLFVEKLKNHLVTRPYVIQFFIDRLAVAQKLEKLIDVSVSDWELKKRSIEYQKELLVADIPTHQQQPSLLAIKYLNALKSKPIELQAVHLWVFYLEELYEAPSIAKYIQSTFPDLGTYMSNHEKDTHTIREKLNTWFIPHLSKLLLSELEKEVDECYRFFVTLFDALC